MLFLMDPTTCFLAPSATKVDEVNNGCSLEYTVGLGDVVEIASPVVDGSVVYPDHLGCNISIGLHEAARSVSKRKEGLPRERLLPIYRNAVPFPCVRSFNLPFDGRMFLPVDAIASCASIFSPSNWRAVSEGRERAAARAPSTASRSPTTGLIASFAANGGMTSPPSSTWPLRERLCSLSPPTFPGATRDSNFRYSIYVFKV